MSIRRGVFAAFGLGLALAFVLGVLFALAVIVGALPFGSARPPGAPAATVDGLPIMSVADAIALRASGQANGRALAIAGFYSEGPGHSCPAPMPFRQPAPLEMYCRENEVALAQLEEPAVEVQGFMNGFETSAHAFVGPHLTPFSFGSGFAGRLFAQQPASVEAAARPVAVVAIGHFFDPRAVDCSPDMAARCLSRFVIDRLAWAHGQWFGADVEADGAPGARLDESALRRITAAALGADSILLQAIAVRPMDVAALDPTLPVSALRPGPAWEVWAVTGIGAAHEPARDRIGRLVVDDATGSVTLNELAH